MTTVLKLHALMVSCILDDIPLYIGQLLVNEIDHFKNQVGKNIFYTSLFTKIFKRAGVEEYVSEIWACPSAPIYQLRIQRQGALRKSKKRKIKF